jgi:hypothetical protein
MASGYAYAGVVVATDGSLEHDGAMGAAFVQVALGDRVPARSVAVFGSEKPVTASDLARRSQSDLARRSQSDLARRSQSDLARRSQSDLNLRAQPGPWSTVRLKRAWRCSRMS